MKWVFIHTRHLVGYAAFLLMVLREHQYLTKNKTYYANNLDERPYYRPQFSINRRNNALN